MNALWPCPAMRNAELSGRTTLNVGGRAEWLLEPSNPEELVDAWCAAREEGFHPRLLGGGANLLIPDGTLPGVVITTARMARLFRPDRLEETRWEDALDADEAGDATNGHAPVEVERPELVAWAGMPMPGIVRASRELGWSGLEGLAGVPGHIGGGVAMNAGGRWGELWDVVERVRVLGPDGTVEERPRGDCQPGYRDGNLGGAIVLGVHLVLQQDDRAVVKERIRAFMTEKNAVQPVTERSCGCIFKNPDPELSEGRSAGRLIEDCGGKSLARGAARVSEKHANFIVNGGGARAADVGALIEDVRRLVRDRSGVELAVEVKRWDPVEADGTPAT